jgi:hypothetical protein
VNETCPIKGGGDFETRGTGFPFGALCPARVLFFPPVKLSYYITFRGFRGGPVICGPEKSLVIANLRW